MKGIVYLAMILLLAGVSACGQRGASNGNGNHDAFGIDSTLKKTTLNFLAVEHDFGQVREGEKVTHVYEVQNTGKADLLLQSVRPSCGCTTPKYEKKPIRPGRKGTIEVVFDTKGRPGMQRKSILVITNTEPPNTVLFFNCEVMPAEAMNN